MLKLRTAVSFIGLLMIACLVTGCFGGLAGIGLGTDGSKPGITGSGQPTDPKMSIPRSDAELPPHVSNDVLVGVHPGADIQALAAAIDAELLPSELEQINVVHLRLNGDNRSITDALRTLKDMEGVRYSQPNYTGYRLPYMKASAPIELSLQSMSATDDPYYDTHQYGPQRIQAPAAWEAGYTGSGTIIAVIDTGVAANHPDLAGRVLPGANPLYPQLGTADFEGHGTHVAGIAAAGMGDGVGIVGVAPDAWIFPIRVFNPTAGGGSGAEDLGIALGLLIAANPSAFGFLYPPADVANLSLGGQGYSQVIADAVHYALEQGVVVVATMGNDYVQMVKYPAAYPGVIAVGATDPQDQKADFSTTGKHISVTAPGVGIHSTVPYGNGYDRYSGTSMAAPHVAGAVALLREARPGISPAEVKQLLEQTADLAPGLTTNRELGHGRINVARALGIDKVESEYGSIAVWVQDLAGGGIYLADVVLFRGDQAVANVRTGGSFNPPFDNDGLAVFRDLEPGGGYTLTVRLDQSVHGRSALQEVQGIEVQAGKTTEVIVGL